MAFTPLSTDFKDEILSEVNTQRKYKQTVNEDNTISLQDMTAYEQEGTPYTAKHVIEERKAINEIYENKVTSTDELDQLKEDGHFVDALLAKKLSLSEITDSDEQQIYTLYGGKIKVVSGTTVVNASQNIGYVRVLSNDELKALFGESFNTTRLSVKTYNGDSVAQEVHFYAPEVWKGEIFQYFYPTNIQGPMRINYKMEYKYA